VLAFAVSTRFAGMLALYLALTTAYSLRLKSIVLLDVIVLSLLYTLRIVAGAVAVDIGVSHWMLAFSVLTFLSLALVKRCSELVLLRQSDRRVSAGRDYRVGDLEVLCRSASARRSPRWSCSDFSSMPPRRPSGMRCLICSGWCRLA